MSMKTIQVKSVRNTSSLYCISYLCHQSRNIADTKDPTNPEINVVDPKIEESLSVNPKGLKSGPINADIVCWHANTKQSEVVRHQKFKLFKRISMSLIME